MDKYIIDGVEYSYGEEVEVLDSKTGVWLLDILQGVDSSQVRKFLCVSGHWEFIRKLQPKPHKYQEVIDLIENLPSVAVDSTKNILVGSKENLLERIKNLK